jgi:hypothetical protein
MVDGPLGQFEWGVREREAQVKGKQGGGDLKRKWGGSISAVLKTFSRLPQ